MTIRARLRDPITLKKVTISLAMLAAVYAWWCDEFGWFLPIFMAGIAAFHYYELVRLNRATPSD